MSIAPPKSRREAVRRWFRRSDPIVPLPPSSAVLVPNPPPSSTQLPFEDRVLSLLSQQDQDIIRPHLVSLTGDIDSVIRSTFTATQQAQAISQAKRWTTTFRGRTIVVREEVDKIVAWLDRFKDVGDLAASTDPVHVGLPWAGIRLLLEVATSEHNQTAALVLGVETALYLSNRLRVYMAFLARLADTPARQNFAACLLEFHAMILRFLAQAIRIYQQGSMARGFKAFWHVEDILQFQDNCYKIASRADIEANNCDRDVVQKIETQLQSLELVRNGIDRIERKLDRLSTKVDLKLPVAIGAAFNSYQDELDARCLPGTRVDLLQSIDDWSNQDRSEPIFWLSGMAGTGKSTISRTVAQTFFDRSQLGASFFFKRGEADRGNASLFFSTIAGDLICQESALQEYVQQAIEVDPGITSRTLKEQFDHLIFQPLASLQPMPATKLIIVIDALDECEREGDIRTIIALLARLRELGTIRLRVFLTSRPKLPIRLGFTQLNEGSHRDVILHEIPPSIIKHDISMYLRHEFTLIRKIHGSLATAFQSLDPSWPGTDVLADLTRLSVPLFIVAATICRFIGELKGNPVKRLEKILRQPVGERSQLERTYLPILGQILTGEDDEEINDIRQSFRSIVGSIVLLANPLSAVSVTKLLNVPLPDVNELLQSLHSVLWVPADPDAPIRLLHLSFREFLVKKSHGDSGQQMTIDECSTHGELADRCLIVLRSSDGLRKDLCQLQQPGALQESIERTTIERHIPPHVQYACRYWIHHVQASGRKIHDGDQVDIFLRKHFLHWLECLSLLGYMSESISMIGSLRSIAAEVDSYFAAFIDDARRFILTYHFVITQAPPQVYGAALHFSPSQSITRQIFPEQKYSGVEVLSDIPKQWSSCLQTYEGHSDAVISAVFSPDGSLMASGSYDNTVRIWDVQTGQCRHQLEGHSHSVTSVAFSHDGSLVVSGSYDKTVRVWDVQTGQCRHQLEGHCDGVTSVMFSPDGSLVASGSRDKTVRIWDVQTGQCRHQLEGHCDEVTSVVFSPDGSLVASGSWDKTVRIWDVQTGQCRHQLEGHSDWVNSVVFSPDGSLVASGSWDKMVRIWDTINATGVACHHSGTHQNEIKFNGANSNIWINGYPLTLPSQARPSRLASQPLSANRSVRSSLGITNRWIVRNSERILWLPPEYRPGRWTCFAKYIAIGTDSGRVVIIRYLDEGEV
ncbi:uncharacterized protein PV06_11164 [Exophiala oligosperma]|uniref:Nephrocystin 3-like N-terminal domain-containing protein n=1 Tax=Exophiala oligosperma TaxID=215243 RepID=A0A0D2BGP3_9EURO|nr:uncharacterized protein PV06_11164 [Exophiala oligosperma]KIW36652.1 hypothetical protein PV06_11164 [Exophiala oligosperma]